VTDVLSVAALLGAGLVSGVMFAVAISTAPALARMTPAAYLHAHKLLGRNWDPTMPVIVLTSIGLDVALAVITSTAAATALFAGAALSLAGVSVVSHLCNVPINRRMRDVDPAAVPADWDDPRPVWRRWHLARTALAVLALLLNGSAVVVS
jgi:uncharacterized membrane protein